MKNKLLTLQMKTGSVSLIFFLLALLSVQLSTALNTVPFSQTVRFLLIFHTDINLLYDCDINIPVAKCLCSSFFPKTDFWAWNWIINCRVKRQAYPPTGIFYHNFQTYRKKYTGDSQRLTS